MKSKDNEQLEQKLNEALEEVRRLESELEQFVRSASHNLQEPLRAISLFIELIRMKKQKNKAELSEQEFEELIDVIYQSSIQASDLVRQLARFSKLSKEPVKKTKLNFNSVFKKSISNFDSEIKKNNVKIDSHEVSQEIFADETQIQTVFDNLLSNCFRFRKANEPLAIKVSSSHRDGEVVISVKDNGIGIDSQFHDRVTKPFQRLDAKASGSGMGLAIAKKIIDRHKGKLWFESQAGKGSQFSFSLPNR